MLVLTAQGSKAGYEALAALDDNRDGEFCGSGLDGLTLWQDGNGISHPAEVTPLPVGGIQAHLIRPDSDDNGSPMTRHGVRLQSAQWLATWDWTLAD